MKTTLILKRLITPVFIALLTTVTLCACSGGSSSSSTTPPPPASAAPVTLGVPIVEPITVDNTTQTLHITWHTTGGPGAYWQLSDGAAVLHKSAVDLKNQLRSGSEDVKANPGVYHLTVSLCDQRSL